MAVKKVAWMGLVLAGCGSPAFIGSGFDEEDDGGVDAPVQHDVAQEVGEDAGSVDAAEEPSCDRYVVFSGESDSYVSFLGPDVEPPLEVELRVKLASEDRVGLYRRGPENPCGWHLFVEGDRLRISVIGSFEHEEVATIAGTGWRTVRWELGAESVLFVDGNEVGRHPWEGSPMTTCSGQTILGPLTDFSGAPYTWGRGVVDFMSVGLSRWNFDEEEGYFLDEAGSFPGNPLGSIQKECL